MSHVALTPVAYSLTGRINTHLAEIGEGFRKYAAYRRTLSALYALPTETLIDLDLNRVDLKSLARKAVYNR